MWHIIYHYLYQDIWEPVWPNWCAAVPGVIWAGVLAKRWEQRKHQRHQEQLAHIDRHFEALHKNLGIQQAHKPEPKSQA